MTPPSNFSSGASGLQSSNGLTDPDQASGDHLTIGRKAAALIIDSGVLGDGPFNAQIAGNVGDTPGASNQLTVTVSSIVPPTPPA